MTKHRYLVSGLLRGAQPFEVLLWAKSEADAEAKVAAQYPLAVVIARRIGRPR